MLSPSKNIIVIAPDVGLRQSLMFALEVEGYQVEAHDSWGNGRTTSSPALCMIVDDQVLQVCGATPQALLDADQPIILLSDGMSAPMGGNPGFTLTKPFDGADLLSLVRSIALAA